MYWLRKFTSSSMWFTSSVLSSLMISIFSGAIAVVTVVGVVDTSAVTVTTATVGTVTVSIRVTTVSTVLVTVMVTVFYINKIN
jgi:hypothetical protein